jgi:2-desacetyl-2-hydroxyethyl bacteriochlorophyllide A dehydrogenase
VKKLVWQGGDNLMLEQSTAPPPVPGRDEVLLNVRAVGICGTDIHILKGTLAFSKPPLVLGHEISGQIVAVGENVGNVHEGDRVTVDSVTGCGRCSLCQRGRVQFCPQGSEFGITRDGGCQDYLVLPKKNVHQVPDAISYDEAAILDMEVYQAVIKCGIEAGDRVLVLGAGPIGLIACQVAQILGAGHITLSDIVRARLDVAERLGIADAYVPVNNQNGSIAAASDTAKGFDVVIDCAGTSHSSKFALQATRPCGRLLLYGVHEQEIEQLDLNQIVMKDLVVFGAQSDRNRWDDVIALVASGRLNLKDLITHRLPLEAAAQAYSLVRNHDDSVIKAVFQL